MRLHFFGGSDIVGSTVADGRTHRVIKVRMETDHGSYHTS
jgi:hypothetical protein